MLKACDEILGSSRLRKVLGIVLKVGNRLNSSGIENEKCYADGFTIDTLSKLSHIKAFDKKTTLLFYIVSLIQRNNESLLSIKDDIPNVFAAQKTILDYNTHLDEVKTQLDNVQKIALEEANKLIPDTACDEKNKDETELLKSCSIGVFTLDAARTLGELHRCNNEVKLKISLTQEYFAEAKEKAMKPGTLFTIISTFVQEIDFALTQLTKDRKKKVNKIRILKEKNKCFHTATKKTTL